MKIKKRTMVANKETKPRVRFDKQDKYLREVFSWNFKRALGERGMSQMELARKMRTSPGQVSKWINGVSWPTSRNMVEICHALECTPDWLLKDHYAS